jgi:catecholate siderophore receptor
VRNLHRKLAQVSVIALVAGHAPALAQDGGGQAETQIIVTGTSEGYVATDSVTATKTDTPLIDVPQTVNVVTREQIEDQAHHGMADVLRYVPGVTVGQGEANRDQITIRGQNTTADFFLDGVRDDVQYFRSLYNIERVEVLKGPYAMIFGRGGGGGIINRVQKTPLAEPLLAGSASVNSEGGFDVAVDVNQPLGMGMDAAVRLNAFYERLESHRDFVSGERFAVNPNLAFTPAEGWRLGLSFEHVEDDRVPDRGVPSVECGVGCIRRPLSGHRDTFFGVPGMNDTGLDANIVKLRLDGELTPDLTWSTTALYGDYDKFYSNVFPNSAVRQSDNTFQLDGYRDDTDRENLLVQSNLVWDLDLGTVDNTVLFGVEYGQQDTANMRFVAPAAERARIDVDKFTYPTFTFPFPNRSRETVSDVEVFSAYAQDQVGIGEHLILVAGLRYDRFEITGTDIFNSRDFGRTDEKVSPRFGLIAKPQPNVSLYASYSRSFLPRSGDQFISLTPANEALEPERFTNYELGTKWDVRPDLSLTAAVFRLDRTNTTTPDPNPNNPTGTIVAGAARTTGAELAVVGQLTPEWQVSAGYTYQDAHMRGNDAIRVAQVPRHQLALWNRYDFTPAFGIGVGLIHQSSQWAALHNPSLNPANGLPVSPATRLPSFTRIDAAVFYDVSDGIGLQLNVENVFDEEYFGAAHNNNNITVGAPLNARLTARVKL